MFHHVQVLDLGLELLVRVVAPTQWIAHTHLLHLHLLLHLAGGWILVSCGLVRIV